MACDIVFVEEEGKGTARAVGESVFLSRLPTSPKVFAFFYPGSSDTEEVQKELRALGQKTGGNLFVNIAKTLDDPDYQVAVGRFRIRGLPVIVVTAVSPLASTPEGQTAFVRLEGKELFKRPQQVVETVEQLFNLFLRDEIAQAVMAGWVQRGNARLVAAAEAIWAKIQGVIAWAAKKDISLEFLSAKIEVKERGGPG
jgi:hypothetical protein